MDLSYYKNMEPIFGEWHIKRLIGEGNFGKVFEIERTDFGRTYSAALKVITIPQNESEVKSVMADGMDEHSITVYYRGFVSEMIDEFALMSSLKGNSNIVSYEDHKVIEHRDAIGWDILIRMELLTPLIDHIAKKGMTRQDVTRLGIDLCRALECCQKQNVIHRDIKPENIFVANNGNYKLGDFGIARTAEKTTSGLSKKGTYNYMAPEVYLGRPYGPNVDIYSLGLVLYRLLNNNRAPFLPAYPTPITFSDRETANTRRISGEPIPAPANADADLAAVVLRACAYDPARRFATPEEMRLQLEQLLHHQNAQENICTCAVSGPIKISTASNRYIPAEESSPTEGLFAAPRRGTATDRPAAPAQATPAQATPAQAAPVQTSPAANERVYNIPFEESENTASIFITPHGQHTASSQPAPAPTQAPAENNRPTPSPATPFTSNRPAPPKTSSATHKGTTFDSNFPTSSPFGASPFGASPFLQCPDSPQWSNQFQWPSPQTNAPQAGRKSYKWLLTVSIVSGVVALGLLGVLMQLFKF